MSREVLTSGPQGGIILGCPHPQCRSLFCYHCLRPTNMGEGCHACIFGAPVGYGNFNRFFRRAEPPAPDQSVLPRNYELTPTLCAAQLEEICAGDTLETRCRGCHACLHKSAACNELRHCGLVVCDHCGMAGAEGEKVLIDHWDPRGRAGCPRYDDDRFWRRIGLSTLCDHRCCAEESDCTVPEHVERRRRQDYVRKMTHIDRALESLPVAMRQEVVDAVQNDEARAMILAARGGLEEQVGPQPAQSQS